MIEFGSEKENIFTMPFLIQELEEKDISLAIKWYKKAAKQAYDDAVSALVRLDIYK